MAAVVSAYEAGAFDFVMKLTYGQAYLSITSFPDIEIPDFTLITGTNGAGKSHLLHALRSGFIKSDVAPAQSSNNQNEIRFFDWSNLIPQDTGYFSSDQIRGERTGIYQNFSNIKQSHMVLEPVRDFIRKNNLDQKYLNDPAALVKLGREELLETLNNEQAVDSILSNILQIIKDAGQRILNNFGDPNMKGMLVSVSETLGKPIIALSERDIMSPQVPSWGHTDMFQQQFARLFVSYRDIYLANQIAQFRKSKGFDDANPLEDDDFVKLRGSAPWEFVNKSLEEAGLDFRINSPDLTDYIPYQPQLTKISSGIVVPFANLSSGEKILMSFAFCVYYASDRRQISTHPKIILLDEVDAPLHPSMSKNLINTITNVLVGEFGIKVIATTHSPSTVALAPEEAIYTMRSGQPGLHKASKSAALDVLTEGVPTLAISYDGRRQVFVESSADAEIYDDLYRIYKGHLNSERSLDFIATGKKKSDGSEENSGCDIVKNLVDRLKIAGNGSVFGLLDWDGHHNQSDRIVVLAHDRRNGLENVIFDPLLIALVICRDCIEHKPIIDVGNDVGFIEICSYKAEQLQPIVTKVCEKVLKSQTKDIVVAEYIDGMRLNIDKRWFVTDDHELEGLIIDAFPGLQAITKRQAGKLMQHIIKRILVDKKEFGPIEITTVLRDLLTRD